MIRLPGLALLLLLAACSANDEPAPTQNEDAPWFQRLTTSSQAEISPVFSPDGSKLVYERAGAILVLEVATRVSRSVTPQGNHPSWTADGTGIVFVRRYSPAFSAPTSSHQRGPPNTSSPKDNWYLKSSFSMIQGARRHEPFRSYWT